MARLQQLQAGLSTFYPPASPGSIFVICLQWIVPVEPLNDLSAGSSAISKSVDILVMD